MNHLERLIAQYYEWQGYVVRVNTLVGRRPRGGYECELDICAFHPESNHLVHIEPSLDAFRWDKRELRFQKKFQAGTNYIKCTVFPWLRESPYPVEQIAILIASSQNHTTIGGGRIVNLDQFISEVRVKIAATGIMARSAIPERFDLLRTIQLLVCGYYRSKI